VAADAVGVRFGDACWLASTGMLSQAMQDKAIKPHAGGRRRIVLASPVAESSLTIPGVRVCAWCISPDSSMQLAQILTLHSPCSWRPTPRSTACPS
jgi:hypothetical protein